MRFLRPVLYLVWKEYLHVVRDRATLFQALAIPLVQMVVLAFAATFEIRESRVHLVDLDQSTISRGLATRLEASDYFRIERRSQSPSIAEVDLLSGEADVIMQIPRGFERDIVRQRAGDVQFVVNAEQGVTAGIIRSYLGRITNAYAREIDRPITHAIASAPIPATDIRIESRSWYNPALDYKHYMVPGILVALVTIIGTLLTAQNIAREKELGTLEQLNVSPLSRGQFILGKLLPFWGLAMVELAAGLTIARLAFGVPLAGNIFIVFVVGAFYLFAALGLGLLISTVADTQQQAMFVTFFVMMVYLLMSGLYTPISSMPAWVQWLAEVNPVKHFVQIMRAVLVKGAGPAEIVRPTLGGIL